MEYRYRHPTTEEFAEQRAELEALRVRSLKVRFRMEGLEERIRLLAPDRPDGFRLADHIDRHKGLL
jgi:hypothetical protein